MAPRSENAYKTVPMRKMARTVLTVARTTTTTMTTMMTAIATITVATIMATTIGIMRKKEALRSYNVLNARLSQRHDRMRNGISNNVCSMSGYSTYLILADVRTYAICPQCLDPFVWANQYLSHKCIRKMKDPKIDFQACRIMRKVRRQWEKLQSKRLPPPTTGRHFAKKKRCAAEMQPRTPTHRKRQRARPAATQNESDNDNNSAPRASDAYQRPDDILVAGKETDYRQIAPGLLSASNEPDDEGMWFRGNMFLRPQFEPGPWFSGNIGTESLGQQEPCSQYLSRSSTIPGHGGTIPQELSHHWQPPVAPPKTAGMISEHSSSRWGQPGQYLGDARTTSGNGAWQATFPVNGPHPADT